MDMVKTISDFAEQVRSRVPLVHNITNYVTVNDVANAELAIGGSALMADDIDEVADMVKIANATNINIGTLNSRTIKSMLEAGKQGNETKTPVIFDPVGAGASTLRNDTTRAFLDQVRPTVIRGNLSEMSFVAGLDASTRGVDSAAADSENDAIAVAQSVASAYRCVAAVTGAVDIVTDGTRVVKISNGTPLMSKITGTGCMCDGVIGCFAGALDDFTDSDALLDATAAAICSMGLAGELAEQDLKGMGALVGTGSLHIGIIDRLSLLNADDYRLHAKVEVA
ncbi:MAG: hydroxyethylthiazole kinase [Coriobacteriales bacterium]|jgi:hydroxyethylthiazole kinase